MLHLCVPQLEYRAVHLEASRHPDALLLCLPALTLPTRVLASKRVTSTGRFPCRPFPCC